MYPLSVTGGEQDNYDKFITGRKANHLLPPDAIRLAKEYVELYPTDIASLVWVREPTGTSVTYETMFSLSKDGWWSVVDDKSVDETHVVMRLKG